MSVPSLSSVHSSQFLELFGLDRQADFSKRSDQAVTSGLGILQEALASPSGPEEKGMEPSKGKKNSLSDSEAVFKKVTDHLAQIRNRMALDHQTPNAELFGLDKMDHDNDVLSTPLRNRYSEYESRFSMLIKRVLEAHVFSDGKRVARSHTITEVYLERTCSFKLEVFTEREARAKFWHVSSHPDMAKIYQDPQLSGLRKRVIEIYTPKTERESPLKMSGTALPCGPLVPSHNKRQFIDALDQVNLFMKEHYKQAYTQRAINDTLQDIGQFFPDSGIVKDPRTGELCFVTKAGTKPFIIQGTARLEMENKMVALSKYVVVAHLTNAKGLQIMGVIILHQDKYLISRSIKEASLCFTRAIQMNMSLKGAVKALSREIATMRYIYAHAMPKCRGAAWIGERLEKIAYRAHQIKCSHKETMGDMEAIIAPLYSTFMKTLYKKTVALTRVREVTEKSVTAPKKNSEKSANKS